MPILISSSVITPVIFALGGMEYAGFSASRSGFANQDTAGDFIPG
jgi:hypothetical protein